MVSLKKLICLHMKRVAPFDVKKSNANLIEWNLFLMNNSGIDFIIIDDDPLPREFSYVDNVFHASDIGMELSVQLALVGNSDGFIAMASGICNAANFSDIPHVLFKHPEHHVADMRSELGDWESFIFQQANSCFCIKKRLLKGFRRL